MKINIKKILVAMAVAAFALLLTAFLLTTKGDTLWEAAMKGLEEMGVDTDETE